MADQLNIISMHAMKEQFNQLGREGRRSYLDTLLENTDPDVCVLPGDSDDAGKTLIQGYDQRIIPNLKTMVLSKKNRTRMTNFKIQAGNYHFLKKLDFNYIVCLKVEVLSARPAQTVVKTFNLVLWEDDMVLRETSGCERKKQTEEIVKFCQLFAIQTQLPVLVAGDFRQPSRIISPIVANRNNKLMEEVENDNALTAEYKKYGFLQSMIHGNMRPLRQMYKMAVHGCSKADNSDHSTYFLASNELELKQSEWLDFEVVTGRQITMEALKKHCPVQTSISVPNRPPRHIGG